MNTDLNIEQAGDETRRAEAALQHFSHRIEKLTQKNELLSLVTSLVSDAVLVCDADGLVEWVNEGFTRLTGRSFQQVQGEDLWAALAGSTDPSEPGFPHSRSNTTAEIRCQHQDGHWFWASLRQPPLSLGRFGQSRECVLIATDISAERAYRQNQEVSVSGFKQILDVANQLRQAEVLPHQIVLLASLHDVADACHRRLGGIAENPRVEVQAPTDTVSAPVDQTEAARQPVNFHAALERIEGDTVLFSDLVQFFRNDYRMLLHEIQQSVEAHASESLARASNRLKGLVGNISADEAWELVCNLEKSANEGNWDNVPETVRLLERQLTCVDTFLEAFPQLHTK